MQISTYFNKFINMKYFDYFFKLKQFKFEDENLKLLI